MKKQILIIIYLFSFLLFLFSEYKKDLFSIVLIPKNNYLNMYLSPDDSSKIINKISAGYTNIKTTWNTVKKNNDFWIELELDGKKGWVNRIFVTRHYGVLGKNNEKEIENLLFDLTKSLQQENFDIFKNIFYSLRGINIFEIKNKKLIKYKYNELNILWKKIFKNNQNTKKIFDDILNMLESDFKIDYLENVNIADYQIPIELINFQFISLNYNDKTIYIGIEFWNNKAYICNFCIGYF